MSAFLFWTARPLADLMLILGMALTIAICAAFAIILTVLRQSRCKHPYFRETSACDAICRACGKNLGFIDDVRISLNKSK